MRSWWVGPVVAGVLVLAGCSQDGSPEGAAPGSAAPSSVTPGPVVVSAGDRGDAVQVLTNDEADRMDAINLAGARYPKAFAGSWWDHEANEPVVFVVDGEEADSLRAADALRCARVEERAFTERDLAHATDVISDRLDSVPGIVGVGGDQRTNGLTVEVQERGLAAVKEIAARRSPDEPQVTTIIVWSNESRAIMGIPHVVLPRAGAPSVVEARDQKVTSLTEDQASLMGRIAVVGESFSQAYGGSWWNHERNEPVVAVVDANDSDALRAKVAALGARRVNATFSLRSLRGHASMLLGELGPDVGVLLVGVDTARNGLMVEVREQGLDAAKEFARTRASDLPPITEIVVTSNDVRIVPADK